MTTPHITPLKPDAVKAELVQVEKAAGMEHGAALTLRRQFADYYTSITGLRKQAEQITDPANITHQKAAREVRLGLRKVRCDVENTRKALKAESLSRGKAIDGFANVLKYLCEPIEAQLADIEHYAARQEAARIAALVKERTDALVAIGGDPIAYNLGEMDAETWEATLATAKTRREERIEAERRAEAERIKKEQADAQERERIRKENEALRAEADKREAAAKKEREAAAKEQRALQAKLDAEKQKRQAAERAEKQRAADEAARIKATKAAAQKAARAPDKERILTLANQVESMQMPDMNTEKGKETADNIRAKAVQFAAWIRDQAAKL